jgi:hypothetical protein
MAVILPTVLRIEPTLEIGQRRTLTLNADLRPYPLTYVKKQVPAMRLVKLELEIFRWGLVVFRFGWCVSEAEGRRICATP